jgi:hypothetical protein
MLRARLVLLGSVLFAALAVASPAAAGVGDPVDCQQNSTDPNCSIQVDLPGSPGNPGGTTSSPCRDLHGKVVPCSIPGKGWYGGDGCWYQPAAGDQLTAAVALGGTPSPPARWYVGACGDPATNWWPTSLVKFRILANGPGPELLAQEAVKHLRLPAPIIQMNPAPPAPQVVSVPTWLWIDQDSWGSRSATASVGDLSVTATARPVKVVWSTGDGRSVTCAGPGTPWTAGMDPAAASPSCGHTYTTASGGGPYAVQATVTWEISWAGGGVTGTEPPLVTTATVNLRVVEAGGLNTNGGRRA